MKMLSKSISTVKAKRLISNVQTLMMTVPKVGQKFSHVMPPYLHVLTAYKGAVHKQNFRIELLHGKRAVVQFF